MLAIASSMLMFAQMTGQHGPRGPMVSIGGLFFCGVALIGLGLFAFWLWMLIDCLMREFPQPNDKVVWVLVIALLNWLGALIYLIVGRPKGAMPGTRSTGEPPRSPLH